MGIFSSKKKTYVSSVAYPLGEDGEDRVDYLQYTVLNATLQNRSVGEAITNGYLRGQGMALRNSFRYARDVYTNGVPTSAASYLDQPDPAVITPVVQPRYPGAEIVYLANRVGMADFEWWAEQHLTEKYGYDRTLGEFIRPPKGVDANAAVAYDLEDSGLVRILLMNDDGATKVVEFRPAGYTKMAVHLHSCYQARTIFVMKDETVTRDAAPGEVDTVQVDTHIVDRVGERQERFTRIETDIVNGQATVHTRITMTVTTRPQYLLYKLGSGKHRTLDKWLNNQGLQSPYYPAIPLRIDNESMVSGAKKNTPLYKTSEKLLKKLGANLEKIGAQIEENEQIDEIDFAFVTFGVDLKTESQEGKRYLYRFFEYLRGITSNSTTKTSHSEWVNKWLAGARESAPEINVVEVYSQKDRERNHDIAIQWDYIDTTLKSGEVFPGAKPGDVDISMDASRYEFTFKAMEQVFDSSKLYARRQIDANTYQEMEISGLVYENHVYKGKAVSITAYDAFHDEDENGFIIPLNQQIVRDTPLIELTNLSYQCMHIVFNCYKIVKKKWYQRGIFKVILVIVAILIVFFTWGAGTPIAISLLGATVIVAGTLMVLLAATLYVLAMMVIMNIVMKVAVDVFGEKWGPVIAAIVGIISMNWESLATLSTTIATTGISATMIMQASMAVLQVYGAYNQGQLSDIQKQMMGLETEFDRKMKEIEDLTKANLDTNTDLIDIYGMTQATNLQFESSEAFLGRTLITGSDVCDISSGLIENFVEVGLQLPTTG